MLDSAILGSAAPLRKSNELHSTINGIDTGRMRLHKLDLNALLVFDALMEHRSVTRAARSLHLGQPALSAALARLREHYGDALLVRSGGAMVPSSLASSLAGPVRELLRQAEGIAHARANFDPAVARRRFTISVSDYTSSVLMPQAMALLAGEAPGVHLTLRVTPAPDSPDLSPTVEALDRRQYDFSVVPRGTHSPRHRAEVLVVDDYRCIARVDHPVVRTRLSLKQYATLQHTVVELSDGRGAAMLDEQALVRAGVSRRVGPVVERFGMLGEVVARTDCIATLPARMAALLASRLPLRVLAPPVALPPLTELVQWKPAHDADAGMSWLRQLLQRAAGMKPG